MSTTPRQTAPEPKSKKGLLIGMALVTLASVGVAAYLWQAKAAIPSAAAETPSTKLTAYYKLEPTFIINLADQGIVRYMQADVQLVTADQATLQAVTTHAPALRNRILLLLGQQTAEAVSTRAGKEALQKAALKEVTAVLKTEKAPANVSGVLFTSMVVQ